MAIPTILVKSTVPSQYQRYQLENAVFDILSMDMENCVREAEIWEEIERTPTDLLVKFLEDQ